MNADTNQPPPKQRNPAELEKAQRELADALDSIMGTDHYWRIVPASGAVTLTHGWGDGSVDTLVVARARAAYGYRENAAGIEVRQFEGTAEEVAEALRALPAPGEPGAPNGSDHTPGPSGTWT